MTGDQAYLKAWGFVILAVIACLVIWFIKSRMTTEERRGFDIGLAFCFLWFLVHVAIRMTLK